MSSKLPKKERNLNNPWKIVYDRFRPAQEGLREALCTLGNGYFATRGAVTESGASRINYPGTYIAGVYNQLPTKIAGRTIYNEDFVNCPNWLLLTFKMGKGDWINPAASKIINYHQELDMKNGVLTRIIRLRDNYSHEVTIETQRIVHMVDPHRAALKYSITTHNYEGEVIVRSALDGTVENTGVARYRQLNSKHLRPLSSGAFSKSGSYLLAKTNRSGIEIAQAAKVLIFDNSKQLRPESEVFTKGKGKIVQEFKIFVKKNHRYDIEKLVSIYTSKDKEVRNPLAEAINSAKYCPRFLELFEVHKVAWDGLWREFDIKVSGDEFSQKVLRLHIFHLIQTASIHNIDIDAGLPARGLHGEAYRGHIFWDELFVIHFFDFHRPRISKSLLMYRYRRLDKAREYAAENNYQGAMFPWQSGSTGEEETQVIHLNPISGKWGTDYSRIQRHVSFAIAYNVWKHYKRTADYEFLRDYGAEILLSIAQFGASLVKYNSRDKKYHSYGVMGPDEFHERFPGSHSAGFKDNAYTNLMIAWTLQRAKQALEDLEEKPRLKLLKKLGIDKNMLSHWSDISKNLNIIIDKEGIISQFEGYFKLKELNWQAYRNKYGSIQRLDRILKAEGKSPDEYKAAKQADVLMIFYLLPFTEVKEIFSGLGYKLTKKMLRKNYEYYIKRTSHGSTLSKVVHCYLSILLGRFKESWQWFNEVLRSDIYDTQGGTTPEGVHEGVMGGSINIVMKGFAGISLVDHKVKINPNLPKHWRSLKFCFSYKGNKIYLHLTKGHLNIIIHKTRFRPENLNFEIQGKPYKFSLGKEYKITLKEDWWKK